MEELEHQIREITLRSISAENYSFREFLHLVCKTLEESAEDDDTYWWHWQEANLKDIAKLQKFIDRNIVT
jgi:hypothetical protein